MAQTSGLLVTAQFDNVTLTVVLQHLHREYGLLFAYENSATDQIQITAEWVNVPIEKVLAELLTPHNYTYQLVRDTYIILPLPKEQIELPVRSHFKWRGAVRDGSSGEALPFATVRIKGTSIGTTANEDGAFTLFDVPSDTCTLLISYVGYSDLHYRMTPRAAESSRPIELFMQQNLMPAAVIYGENMQLMKGTDEVSLQQAGVRDFAALSSPGQDDVFRAAQLLPGIDATGENSSGLIIRGSDSDQSRVILDGMPIYHLDHFFGMYSAINPHGVKNLTVRKGSLDARYGGLVGGIVELSGKDGNLKKPGALLELGLLSTSAVVEVPIGESEKSSFFFTARRSLTDVWVSSAYRSLFNSIYNASVTAPGEQRIDVFNTETRPNFDFFDLNTRITLRPGPNDKFTLSAYAGRDKLNIAYSAKLENNGTTLTFDDRTQWGNSGSAATWRHTWSENQNSNAQFYITTYKSRLESVNGIDYPGIIADETLLQRERNRIQEATAQLNHEWLRPRSTFIAGYFGSRFELDEEKFYNEQFADSISATTITGVFAHSEWRPAHSLRLRSGVRISYLGTTQKTYVDPRFNLTYKPQSNLSFKFSAGYYHQFLSRVRTQSLYLNQSDLWQMAGKELPVIRSMQWVCGARYNPTNFEVEAEFYFKQNRGIFENTGPFTYTASDDMLPVLITGKGQVLGTDLLLRKDLLRHHFSLGYTLLYTTNRYSELPGQVVPERFDQRHEVKFVYLVKLDRWNISAAFYFGSGKPYTPLLGTYPLELVNGQQRLQSVYGDLFSARLPAYHRIDFSARYLFALGKAQCELQGSVFNLYNRKNIRDIQYFAIGLPSEPQSYLIGQRDVLMIGFLPSLSFTIRL